MNEIQKFKKNESLAKYVEAKDFITMSPANAVKELRHVKNYLDIVSSVENQETPSLAKLKKLHSEEKIEAYIKLWILDLNISLNVKNPMSTMSIHECVVYIMDDYYYLTLADFKLFFSGIKKGVYGKMYESVSTPKIMGWLAEYAIDRQKAFEMRIDPNESSVRVRSKNDNYTTTVKQITKGLSIKEQLDLFRDK